MDPWWAPSSMSAGARVPSWTPDALTASRFAWAGLGYPAALAGERAVLTALVAVAVATDLADGPLARWLGVDGGVGEQLDTAADAAFYGSLLAWVYILEPGIPLFRELRPWVVVFVVLVVGTLLVGRVRRGTMAYHTPFTRLSAAVGLAAALWTVHRGYEPRLIQALIGALVLDLGHRTALIMGWIEDPWAGIRSGGRRGSG